MGKCNVRSWKYKKNEDTCIDNGDKVLNELNDNGCKIAKVQEQEREMYGINGPNEKDNPSIENNCGPAKVVENLAQENINIEPNDELKENNISEQGVNNTEVSNMLGSEKNVDQEKQDNINELNPQELQSRGEKRGDSTPNANSSGGERCRKKRKANSTHECEDMNNGYLFSPGIGGDGTNNNKKKVGRRSVKKAMAVARQTGVDGLGKDRKGTSDIYKEFYDEKVDSGGLYVFRGNDRGDLDNKSCSNSLDQVKEVGELIGVSWAKAEAEKEMSEGAHMERQ